MVGTWTQSTAEGYLIYQLTKSPEYLGYVSFANGLPSWFFTLYAGAIADRVPRRTLMVITQSTMLVLAFIMAILAFTGVVQWWHILILTFLLGISNAFDAPARQAFILEMVDREDMTNAIALKFDHVQPGGGRGSRHWGIDLRLGRPRVVFHHQWHLIHCSHHRLAADEVKTICPGEENYQHLK